MEKIVTREAKQCSVSENELKLLNTNLISFFVLDAFSSLKFFCVLGI